MMKYEEWEYRPVNEDILHECQKRGMPPLVTAAVSSGIFSSMDEILYFLAGDGLCLHDPYLIKDMDKAVKRIRTAVENKEKVAVFGDYDVDGVTSVCTMVRYFEANNVDCLWYIPDRISEGYGLNKQALNRFKAEGVTLVITVDTGVTAAAEAEYVKELGIDLIITDHHTCHDQLPDAVAVLDTFQKDDEYPFDGLAGVGVAYKLVSALEGEESFSRYSDYVTLGTIADVMRMTGENRVLVREGLKHMRHTNNIGLQALLKEAGVSDRPATAQTIGFTLAPRINAAGRLGRAEIAAELLLTNDAARAGELARTLCEMNTQRQRIENVIFQETVVMLEKEHDMPFDRIETGCVVLASKNWHAGVIGIVASRISEKLRCPVFLACIDGENCKGSARGVKGISLMDALEHCNDLLGGYGGHELAAGFNISAGNFSSFKERIGKFFDEHISRRANILILTGMIDPAWVTMDDIRALSCLEPYGTGNPQPVFALENAVLVSAAPIGEGKHVRLRLEAGGRELPCVWFGTQFGELEALSGDIVDAAFKLEINRFRDVDNIQLQIVDLRLSEREREFRQRETELYDRFSSERPLTPEEWGYISPSRNDLAAVWRYINRYKELRRSPQVLAKDILRSNNGMDSMCRIWVALDVFNEFKLISLSRNPGEYTIMVHEASGKVDLSSSGVLRKIKDNL